MTKLTDAEIERRATIASREQTPRMKALFAWMDSQDIPEEERGMFLAMTVGHYLGKMRAKGKNTEIWARFYTMAMVAESAFEGFLGD